MLFLLDLAMVNTNAVKEVVCLVNGEGLNNIAFAASWQTGDVRSGVGLLIGTEWASKAALLVRTGRLVWPRHLTHGAGGWIRKGRQRLELSLPTYSEGRRASCLKKAGKTQCTMNTAL